MTLKKINLPVLGWALYDFAHSAYTTTILTVLFSVYFVRVLVPDGWTVLGKTIPGASLWAYLNTAVMAVVLVAAPLAGALADRTLGKRRQLIFWAVLGSLATLFLFKAEPGRIGAAVAIVFVATLAYEMSLVFYNAFLKEVSTGSDAGWVSGLGFAFGYIGGGLCLLFNMAMIARPDVFGLDQADPTLPHRVAFASVGLWWILFSIPTFLWVKEDQVSHRLLETRPSWWQEFIQSLRILRKDPASVRFVIAYLLYNDGIQTVLLMAAVVGAQIFEMSAVQLGLCYLMIQFVAFVGALVFGKLADRWSHRKVVLITLGVYTAVVMWGVFMKSPREFWVLGFVIGVVLGGSQAASRSLFAAFVPSDRSAAFFGIFSIVGKASSLLGPLVFGAVNHAFGLRAAIGSLLVFFVAGAALLVTVHEPSRKTYI